MFADKIEIIDKLCLNRGILKSEIFLQVLKNAKIDLAILMFFKFFQPVV